MSIKERDIVLQGRAGGEDTIDFPITRLGNIESGAEQKELPVEGDYIPIIDAADNEQMKKFPVQWLLEKLLGKQDKLLGEAGLVVGFNAAGEPEAQSTETLVGPQGPAGVVGFKVLYGRNVTNKYGTVNVSFPGGYFTSPPTVIGIPESWGNFRDLYSTINVSCIMSTPSVSGVNFYANSSTNNSSDSRNLDGVNISWIAIGV